MGESGGKNRVIIIFASLSVVFFLLWLNGAASSNKQKSLVHQKAVLIMELEEKNVKLEKERSDLAEKLRDAESQLGQEKTQHEETKKTLSQEQVAEQALKVELERITRLKESLENDLKQAMAAQKLIK